MYTPFKQGLGNWKVGILHKLVKS